MHQWSVRGVGILQSLTGKRVGVCFNRIFHFRFTIIRVRQHRLHAHNPTDRVRRHHRPQSVGVRKRNKDGLFPHRWRQAPDLAHLDRPARPTIARRSDLRRSSRLISRRRRQTHAPSVCRDRGGYLALLGGEQECACEVGCFAPSGLLAQRLTSKGNTPHLDMQV